MKLLFLRGSVPKDRDPQQIMFDKLEDCDDYWTQLARQLSLNDYGEIWYWGGHRKVRFADNFVERWVPDYGTYKSKFNPNVIFCRGGFSQCDPVLKKFPQAFKIYYGAGNRIYPQSEFKSYNLFLVDTPSQMSKVKSQTSHRVELLIKSAAENIFYPRQQKKEYDVIFSSNEHKKGIKGHGFILPSFPEDLKMIQVGIVSKKTRAAYKNIHFTSWIPRKNIPDLYAKAKIAVVCCTNRDSCPRVIPESLACNCPLLILDSVNVWRGKYINEKTGQIASEANFYEVMREMLESYREYEPYKHYNDNLSLLLSAERIRKMIGGLL